MNTNKKLWLVVIALTLILAQIACDNGNECTGTLVWDGKGNAVCLEDGEIISPESNQEKIENAKDNTGDFIQDLFDFFTDNVTEPIGDSICETTEDNCDTGGYGDMPE